MVMSSIGHSDATEKPDVMLTKLMFLSEVPVLPGTVMVRLPSSALSLG